MRHAAAARRSHFTPAGKEESVSASPDAWPALQRALRAVAGVAADAN